MSQAYDAMTQPTPEPHMYKLYARKNTGSAAVEALLGCLGVTFEMIDVEKTEAGAAPAWFLKVNPRGEIPALQLPDGSVMTESAAIMIYLADAHPEAGLAPASGTPARGQYLRWMIYMAAAAYTSDLRLYYPHRYSTDPSHESGIKAKAIIDLARDFDVFAAEMGAGPFVLGERMTAVDIYTAMLFTWSDDVEGVFARHPKLKTLYEELAANPAVRKAWDRNGMI
jgi:glutathione S-transferase